MNMTSNAMHTYHVLIEGSGLDLPAAKVVAMPHQVRLA